MNPKELEDFIGLQTYKSKTPGIGGTIKQLPDDFVVEEISPDRKVIVIDSKHESGENFKGEFTHCTLQKYNWDTMRAVREISKRLHISQNRIGFAGTKDKRALTTQRISIYNVPVESLIKIKIKDISLGNFRYGDDKIDLGDLWGNRFTATIRNINKNLNSDEIKKRTNQIFDELKYGFPNFFGVQRFGTVRPITHLVGKEILKGNFKKAVMIYLCDIYEGENPEALNARKKLAETKDFKEALKYFPRHLGYEVSVLNYLAKHPGDYHKAIQVLPKKLKMMFVHAYQSFIFNTALSRYIKGGFYVERLPLVGYKTVPDEISSEILDAEGITPGNFKINYMKDLSSKGMIRECFVPVYDFKILGAGEDELNQERNKIIIQFSLPKGCYATSLLREFMKN